MTRTELERIIYEIDENAVYELKLLSYQDAMKLRDFLRKILREDLDIFESEN